MRTSNSPARLLYAAALDAASHLREAGKMSHWGRWWRLSSLVLIALLWTGVCWSGAAAQTSPRAYILRINDQSTGDYAVVTVIDTATKNVIVTIPVSDDFLYFDRIAFTPDGSRAYVTNSGVDTITVINTATITVIATIPGGRTPRGVAFTPDGSRAYVAARQVPIIDTARNQIVDSIGGFRCFGIAIGPAPPDEDGDGVANGVDQCPSTAAGEVVDATGCSIPQLAPCAGPSPGTLWRNHGAYVSTVTYVAERFLAAGLITSAQKDAIVAAAAQSSCGK
jgi:YVTN family beta-propeller protein